MFSSTLIIKFYVLIYTFSVDAFNDLSLYLKNNSLDVCHPMMDRNGKYVTYHDLPNNNAVRLVTFLPGKLLFEIPYTETVLFKTGKLIATLIQTMEVNLLVSVTFASYLIFCILQNYKNDVLEKRNFLWSFLNALKVKTFLFAINDARRQAMINEVLERFEKAVLNKLDSLKSGIIHGDLNDQNLIVRKGAGDEWDVYGIIDFGDCHKAPIIFDLAIACTYLMLECKSMDPLLSPAYVIAGYQSLRRVEENEFDIIYVRSSTFWLFAATAFASVCELSKSITFFYTTRSSKTLIFSLLFRSQLLLEFVNH